MTDIYGLQVVEGWGSGVASLAEDGREEGGVWIKVEDADIIRITRSQSLRPVVGAN